LLLLDRHQEAEGGPQGLVVMPCILLVAFEKHQTWYRAIQPLLAVPVLTAWNT